MVYPLLQHLLLDIPVVQVLVTALQACEMGRRRVCQLDTIRMHGSCKLEVPTQPAAANLESIHVVPALTVILFAYITSPGMAFKSVQESVVVKGVQQSIPRCRIAFEKSTDILLLGWHTRRWYLAHGPCFNDFLTL